MDRLLRRMKFEAVTFEPNAVRFFYRLTFLHGIWLLFINALDGARGFALLSTFGPHYAWGLFFLFMAGRLYYAERTRNIKTLRDALFGASILWLFITISIVVSNSRSIGIVLYGFITYNLLWLYISVAERYRLRQLHVPD